MQFRRWMIPLILIVFFSGIRMLNADILWFDESKTVLFAGARHFGPLNPIQIWNGLAQNNPWQSPGYFIALNLWSRLTGWSDFAARYLSLLIGIVTLAGLYRMASEIFSHRIGLYAAITLSGSSLYIHYLHEMRPYTLYLLFSCITVWAYWRIINHQKQTPSHYILLFIGLTGLAYTHVFALLTAFGIGGYHLLFAPKNRPWLLTTGVMILSAITFLPWLQVILQVIGLASEDTIRQDVALFGFEIIETLIVAFGNGRAVLILFLMSGLAFMDKRPATRMVITWLIVASTFAFTLSYLVPAFIHIRYLMSVWIALALLMAIGLASINKNLALPILALWFLIGFSSSLNTSFFESLPNSRYNIPREGFMQMVHTLEEHSRESDMLILHTSPPAEEWDSDDIFAYYFQNIPARYTHMELIRPFPDHFTDAHYQEAVAEELSGVPLIWTAIVPDQVFSRRRLAFFEQLEDSYTLCQTVIDRSDMTLRLYARAQQSDIATFAEESIKIQDLWSIPENVSGTLNLLTGIERHPDLPPDTYSIGIHIYDEDGTLVSQTDFGLSNLPFSCQWSQINLEHLNPGDYDLHIIAYAWQTGERLLSGDNDSVEVTSIHIE